MVAPTLHSPFLHYEVLGPRAELDTWLGTLQDAGVCHLADALHDLEGEAGIGRPELRAEEVHGTLIQSEAARALRGVARVLPPTPRVEGSERRPAWIVGPGGMGERDALRLKDEARRIATSLHGVLESVRAAEASVDRLDAAAAAVEALAHDGAPIEEPILVLRLSGERARHRRLKKRIEKLGLKVLTGRGDRVRVLVVLGASGSQRGSVHDEAAAFGADAHALPAEATGLSHGAARTKLADLLAAARRVEGEARAALTARVSEHGIRGRFLLDSLEDAEARTAARRHLASTEHVAAARVYVRPEDEPRLREHVRAAHGEVVVMRPLAEADDAPTLPRRIAAAPFAALRGLHATRFGDIAPSAVLALLAPIAVGLTWGDLIGGVLLLLAGGLLGWRAGPGSPRRDTALLAQVAGFAAMLVGALAGRAFGPAGAAWFGDAWGIAAASGRFVPEGFAGIVLILGVGAAALALWGGLLALRAWGRGRTARAGALVQTSLVYAAILGLAAAAMPAGHAVRPLAWLVLPAVALLFVFGGPRRVIVRLGLELVGVLRLVAVGGLAILVCNAVFASWLSPGVVSLVAGSLALLVAALAVVADPAHMAMGVPYDLSLGGRRLGQPFVPFRRRTREDALREGGSSGAGARVPGETEVAA